MAPFGVYITYTSFSETHFHKNFQNWLPQHGMMMQNPKDGPNCAITVVFNMDPYGRWTVHHFFQIIFPWIFLHHLQYVFLVKIVHPPNFPVSPPSCKKNDGNNYPFDQPRRGRRFHHRAPSSFSTLEKPAAKTMQMAPSYILHNWASRLLP